MNNNNKDDHSIPFYWKLIFGIVLFLLMAAGAFFVYKYYLAFNGEVFPSNQRSEWGTLGDFFGGILNPIFGFASFLALLATIFYQAKELNASTKELKNSATALAAQNRAIELQSFEQTFFSWLNTYRSLLDSVEKIYQHNSYTLTLSGRRALKYIKDQAFLDFDSKQLKGDFTKDVELIVAVKESWNKLYKDEESQLDSLFRTLYRLFLWVDQNTKLNPTEKWLYISIIRSQLSWIEMVYLFYNCLTERGSKFKTLVEKYAIFDNLAFNNDIKLTALSYEYFDEAFNSDLARKKLGLGNSTYPLAAHSA